MAGDDGDGPDELRVPFVFVPTGAPDPVEWMARHPGWVRFPATFKPHPRPVIGGNTPEAKGGYRTGAPTPNWPMGLPACVGLPAHQVNGGRFGRPCYPDSTLQRNYSAEDAIAFYLRFNDEVNEILAGYAAASGVGATAPVPPGGPADDGRGNELASDQQTTRLEVSDGVYRQERGNSPDEARLTEATSVANALVQQVSDTTPQNAPPVTEANKAADIRRRQLHKNNVRELAALMQSEAGGVSAEAMIAVGSVLLNRMRRNHVKAVDQAWHGFSHKASPHSSTIALAESLLSGETTDPTQGATHFYTPQQMPKEGDEKPGSRGYNAFMVSDTSGGLEDVPGVHLEEGEKPHVRNYRPGFVTYPEIEVDGISAQTFKFFKAPGDGKTM